MRTYDAKAIALQRTGQLGTFALDPRPGSDTGGRRLARWRPDDVFLMTYRENGAQLMRGVTMKELFLYWGGDERGSDYGGPRRDFPICITIAAHATHAAGAAYAIKLRKRAARSRSAPSATARPPKAISTKA